MDATTRPRARRMCAAVTMFHGGLDAIEVHDDWPMPALGSGDVLVRISAAALNNTDIWAREGRYGTAEDPDAIAGWKGVPLDFPRIQGIDVAGVVVDSGEDVDRSVIGRRVMVDPTVHYNGDFPVDLIGSEVDGGFAEFLACSVDRVNDVSASPLSDVQLACLPTAYGTALGMINRAGCASGERVLVTGASGGVGSAAVQLLVNRGCHVIARTSSSNADAVLANGAHEVSVRGHDAIEDLDEVDVAVDVVAGDEFGAVLDRLRDGGRMATAGAIAGPLVQLDVRRLYLRQRRLIGSTMHSPADFAELAEVASTGGLDPIVAEVFPLEGIRAAQERFVRKDFVGKLVVRPHGA
ncbi:MAG: zinc-binding dehydrogenase [Microthrixaceae bacterium]|nr:zinc-binding dehydrogenase [Microthrixaceae bacterium]MCO5320962.1 zinc-binding dehydrogenase [Microthrixaceae bacterium]